LTYGEFDLWWFAELITRAALSVCSGDGSENERASVTLEDLKAASEGLTFLDCGSGNQM
jgi:hypothetical protein